MNDRDSRSNILIANLSQYNGERIGILGGSFDPIHNGHLSIAKMVLASKKLDAVVFVPARQNPLKLSPVQASDQHRVEMLCLALNNEPRFFVSTCELDRKSHSYSYVTAKEFHEQAPDAELFWIGGLDNLIDRDGEKSSLAHWHRKEDFLKLVTFITCTRDSSPQSPEQIISNLSPELYSPLERREILENYLSIPPIKASSSKIRLQCGQKKYADLPVPASVKKHLEDHALYYSSENTSD